MGLGGILIVVGLVGLWKAPARTPSESPLQENAGGETPAGGERVGGLLMMVTGAIFVIAGIIVVLVDLLS